MAKKKVSPKKASAKKPKTKNIPRQKSLPGMGDAKITGIENAALDYAEIRDKRQELTTQEVELKSKLIDLMHKAGKEEYKRNGISVKLVNEKETVKVRVKEEGELETSEEAEGESESNVTVMESSSEAEAS